MQQNELARTHAVSLTHTHTIPEGRERVGLRRAQKREVGARFPDVGGQPRGHGHLRFLARHRVCVLASCEKLQPSKIYMYSSLLVCAEPQARACVCVCVDVLTSLSKHQICEFLYLKVGSGKA